MPRPSRFTPGKETRYPLYRSLGGPQDGSGRLRKISPPPGFDPLTAQSVASRYLIRYPGPNILPSTFTNFRHVYCSGGHCKTTILMKLLDIAVGIVTRVRARRSGFRIPAKARHFYIFHIIQTGSGAYPAYYSMGTGVLSRR